MTAEFRSVQTRMWREDEWFQTLDTDARLLFIYLFTNPSASVSGIYRLPLRTMEFESGISAARITQILSQFAADHKAYYENGVVWVVKMRENQLPGNLSPKVKVRLDKDIASIPDGTLKNRYLNHYRHPIQNSGYPIDTLSIPISTDTDTDTDTDPTTLVAGATPNLSTQFQSLLEELKTASNKPATLRQVYCLCFGESAAPDYGYLGKVARQVGGAGRLAQLMFELVTRPPAGDILAYIVNQEDGRKARKKQTGGNREIVEVNFANGNGNIYD